MHQIYMQSMDFRLQINFSPLHISIDMRVRENILRTMISIGALCFYR